MYGQPTDARRQPSPQGSRHGHGRPPEAQGFVSFRRTTTAIAATDATDDNEDGSEEDKRHGRAHEMVSSYYM